MSLYMIVLQTDSREMVGVQEMKNATLPLSGLRGTVAKGNSLPRNNIPIFHG